MSPVFIVAYTTLFLLVGILFLLGALVFGHFMRPSAPSKVKQEIYECGEPSVGSSFVQFDLRFYVVALVFIIFEVELAFFFPPAVVFGKLNEMRAPGFGPVVEKTIPATDGQPGVCVLTPKAKEKLQEMGVESLMAPQPGFIIINEDRSAISLFETLSFMAMVDIGVFFAVLLVGFAYVWYRGDLDWVRAITPPRRSMEKANG